MNQDLRSEHIVRLISGAKRRLMLPPRRDGDLRRLHARRERVSVVGDKLPGEHNHGELAGADLGGRSASMLDQQGGHP
jgi:hypothetical protein